MKTKLLKKGIFVQTYGTYESETLVIVGKFTKQEIVKYLKKINAKVDFSKWVLEDFDDWKQAINDTTKGQFCYNKKISGTVLMLREPTDTWEYWEILMHETHHIVQHLADMKGMLTEVEAQAYLFEFLFRSLRRKLQCIDKI